MLNTAVSPQKAEQILALNLRADLVTMLKGSPGTGKSAIIKRIAKQYNLKVIDVRLAQCDQTDLSGLPTINRETGKAHYYPLSIFPVEGDPLPVNPETNQPYSGWLLFLDELNAADKAVQKASYKLLLDRELGETKLHERVRIIAAGNLDTDGAIVEDMSSAIKSRICHLNITHDNTAWLKWAREEGGIDHRIISFIEFKPNILYTFNPETVDGVDTYACYRTWEFAHKQLQQVDVDADKDILQALFTSSLSEGVAREFVAFLHNMAKLPTMAQVLAKPDTLEVPGEPGLLYALSGNLGQHSDKDNIEKLMTYVVRLPMEFQVLTLREVLRNDNALMQAQAIQDWIAEYGAKLFD